MAGMKSSVPLSNEVGGETPVSFFNGGDSEHDICRDHQITHFWVEQKNTASIYGYVEGDFHLIVHCLGW